MIDLRERILDVLFGTTEKLVLNQRECGGADTADIQKQISESVLALKQSAIIDNGGVDYTKLRTSELYKNFQQTTAACLRNFNPADLLTQEEKLSFWINLYNLLTIDAVLQFNVHKSVTEGWFGVISFFRRAAYLIGGFRYSLEDIEHGILRVNRGVPFFPGKQFAEDDPRLAFVLNTFDARIHFALNCASRSCPQIAYYTTEGIHKQLDIAAANFIQGETILDKSGVMLGVSRIFKWYAKDFGGKIGILELVRGFLPEDDMRRKLIENFGRNVMMQFVPYDWHLNTFA
jgi:hypothetical protein